MEDLRKEEMENEVMKEIVESTGTEETVEETQMTVAGFGAMAQNTKTKRQIFTNIQDQKKIFNLENNECDYKLNDCKDELIRVKEVLIKRIEKPMAEPEVDQTTGEIIKDKEIKMVTILIDESGKSYVTASKMFSIQMSNYIQMFGINKEGFEIKITDRAIKGSNNKALGFELV